MAVKIRLMRTGKKKQPSYRVVAKEARSPRAGRYIELLGFYNPLTDPPEIKLEEERIKYWLSVGAQPSEKVGVLIKKYGAEGTHVEQQKEALDRLAQARRRPEPPAQEAASLEEGAPDEVPVEDAAPEAEPETE